ncbi:hypothetical protein BDR04DRAFT_1099860 [Suillus decipiens]|nr:hypothetical protein BDR04DRAFT_1099860 [Suillus decipiens]
MRFSFLTAVVALTTSIMSVTAGQPDCTPLGERCTRHSDCCNSDPDPVDPAPACLPDESLHSKGNVCFIINELNGFLWDRS